MAYAELFSRKRGTSCCRHKQWSVASGLPGGFTVVALAGHDGAELERALAQLNRACAVAHVDPQRDAGRIHAPEGYRVRLSRDPIVVGSRAVKI